MPIDGAWGEDLAFDAALGVSTARDWAELAPGEAVRFHPALCGARGGLAPGLAERIRTRAGQIESGATSASADPPLAHLLTLANAAWLRLLAASAEAGRSPPDMLVMARFAFLTGVHPAYLWAEAECSPCWGATAAWLGEWSRHDRAFMPLEVADYLCDVLARSGERTVLRDVTLGEIITDERVAATLLAEAQRRLAGEVAAARWPRVPSRAPLRRLLAALGASAGQFRGNA